MLTYGGGELAMYADTVSELLSAVIPGYDELPSNENGDEAAFVARYEAAIELANLVQTGLVIAATENDGWSPEQVTEDELNALFQSKVVPFVPREGADGTVSAEWRVDVPLVVTDTDYAPFTEREAPFGDNVVFLSPGDEMEFLTSLDQRRLYDIDDPDVAAVYLDELVGDMAEPAMPPEVRSLAGTLRRWRAQILAWHRAKVSNGPTEASTT